MKTVLAIDIGIRNLSMCIMSCEDPKNFETFEINLWETFDTLETDEQLCSAVQKNGKICNRKCNFKYKKESEMLYSCKTHYPKTKTIEKINQNKKKLIKDYLLQDIASIVLKKIQCIYEENLEIFNQLTGVIIELQPTLNPRMKFISHIVYGKIVEIFLDSSTTVRFVGASKKLLAYTGPYIECKLKGAYAKRKWLGVQYGQWFLENKFSNEQRDKWSPTLMGKLDDRFDGLLMAINAITGIPKKNKIVTNKK